MLLFKLQTKKSVSILMLLELYDSMTQSKGKCKVCNYTVTVGSDNTPPDIAAEGVMESKN